MELSEFLQKYDHPDSIILLEGKRKVRYEDKDNLTTLGSLLASKSEYMKFRSGNASGSDQLFSKGVVTINPDRMQNVLPYRGHRKKYDTAGESLALDEMDLAREPEIGKLTKKNKRSKSLIDQYLAGKRNRYTIKAAYLLRDTMKVTGFDNFGAATFGIFYDDIDNPQSGGTGHTMKMCDEKSIPWIDQSVWMKWISS